MLSRRWPKPKWIKHVAAQVGSAHLFLWNIDLYLQIKRSFSFFFHPISDILQRFFFSWFDPNVTIRWSTKIQKVNWFRYFEKNHRSQSLQHSTSRKFVLTFLLRPLMEAAWPENHHLIYIPPFQRWRFSFPIDINFGWPRKSVTHPYQHKY